MKREEALAILRESIAPGDTVRTILRHVSASGMTRWISPIVMRDGETWDATYFVGLAVGSSTNSQNHEGVKRVGCGMDMGFDLVYSLSHALFPDGFDCIGKGCPSNDHSNDRGGRDYSPTRHHSDGGYAISQRWL